MSVILWFSFEVFSNAFDQLLFVYLVRRQLPIGKLSTFGDAGVFLVLTSILTFLHIREIPFVASFLIMYSLQLGYCLTLREGSFWQRFYWPTIVRFAYFLVNQLVTIIMTGIANTDYVTLMNPSSFRLFGMILYMLLIIATFHLFASFRVNQHSLPIKTQTAVIFLSVGCIILAGFIFDYSSALDHDGALLTKAAIIGFMLSSLAWLVLLDALAVRNAELLAVQAEQQRLETEQRLFNTMDALYDKLRDLRHDARNQMLALSGFLEGHELSGLREHVSQLLGELLPSEFLTLTRFPQLDALLSIKLQQAVKLGFTADVQLVLPEQPIIALKDLCALMGNILDNALEALQKVPEERRFLRLRAAPTDGDMWCIRMRNASDGVYRLASGELRTMKPEEWHGLGLKLVRQIAERYDGYIIVEAEEETFEITIYLPWIASEESLHETSNDCLPSKKDRLLP